MKDEMKTNPSCDLISRADAIEAIASAEPKDNEYHYYKHIAIKILSEIPSTEQKTGEWISNHDGSWNCSECGLRVFIYAKGNYCPSCGARMTPYKGGGSE